MTDTNTNKYLKHIKSIITMYEEIEKDQYGHIPEYLAQGFIARACSAIKAVTGPTSSYYQQTMAILQEDWHLSYQSQHIFGIVIALKGELEDGYLGSLPELIHGDLFNNFIDMAEHLLQEGYKDAAAIISGSTLESHLKQLCIKYGIEMTFTAPDGSTRPKKASQLNQDLGKIVYKQYDQKQITAWLDLRNNAAHGKYSEYTDKQVDNFIDGLRDFIERHSA